MNFFFFTIIAICYKQIDRKKREEEREREKEIKFILHNTCAVLFFLKKKEKITLTSSIN